MVVGHISMRNVVTIDRDATVAQAAATMRQHDVGELVVMERAKGGRAPVGLITDRDITMEVTGQDLDPHHETVGAVMRNGLLTFREEEDLADVLRAMSERAMSHAPVIDREGRLTGVISIEDMLGLLAEAVCICRLVRHDQANEKTRTSDFLDHESVT